jgi:hypothetical protein
MQEPFVHSLEQVMKNTGVYLFVLGVMLFIAALGRDAWSALSSHE